MNLRRWVGAGLFGLTVGLLVASVVLVVTGRLRPTMGKPPPIGQWPSILFKRRTPVVSVGLPSLVAGLRAALADTSRRRALLDSLAGDDRVAIPLTGGLLRRNALARESAVAVILDDPDFVADARSHFFGQGAGADWYLDSLLVHADTDTLLARQVAGIVLTHPIIAAQFRQQLLDRPALRHQVGRMIDEANPRPVEPRGTLPTVRRPLPVRSPGASPPPPLLPTGTPSVPSLRRGLPVGPRR